MATAKARHILVDSEDACNELKSRIVAGEDFAEMARQYSKCPSGRRGGELGAFRPGQMVPEFDHVCFNEAVGEVHGPVRTQFGFHLVEVTERND
ncbi:peptidylprolyl isomerase [Desulfovibrio psychrotolerans]|uniref:Peptidylprolyl isomerase n=1 Tax=Desulfovibrio psychrotolerans TaxID=415242 RepID=A0A7J0BPH3_9BACT|nr:peptidylprolyl isomerase [Desulfovibrio psychrotolerans]